MFTTRPELLGTFGMVASTHWLASAVGMRTLEAGGNAFDAAAAAGFTLSVVEPHLNGPGGDAPIIGHRASDGHTFVVCGQGPAPALAAIDAFQSSAAVQDSSGRPHTGLLRADDLAAWRPTEEPTTSLRFAGRTIHKTGAWGQGAVLLQQLAMLEALDVAAIVRSADTEALVHTVVEVAKLAFADREAWYGDDPDVPLETLLSPQYAAERARLVSATASEGLLPGSPDGRVPRVAATLWSGHTGTAPGVGEPTVSPIGLSPGDTCHVDVVDRWGNRVSATPSGGWLQSSPVVPGLGFALPTRAQMFWLEPGLPNSLAPGKRPRTTLSPGLVTEDDGSGFAFGTPGGDQQDQWTVPFLLRHLLGGAGLQAAIDAPAWHSSHVPGSFYPRTHTPRGLVAESRLGADVLDGLVERGHDVEVTGPWELGRISAAGVRPDGLLAAAANPRGMQGYAVGR